MKLGKLQKYWLEQLRKHPERQGKYSLGDGTPQDYRGCCLGELHLCAYRLRKEKLPFNDNGTVVDGTDTGALSDSYEDYGLRTYFGDFEKHVMLDSVRYQSLSRMNDSGITWPEIADYIEQNPENVFTKSV